MIIANIAQLVLVWDFLVKFKLDDRWSGNNCRLQSDRDLIIPLQMDTANKDNIVLSAIQNPSFKEWSQKHSVQANKNEVVPPVPSA